MQFYLKKKHPGQSFTEQRAYRAEYAQLSKHILLEIKNHKLVTKKAPIIGWLEIMYPDLDSFRLTFPQIQGMNSLAV